jgi:hypothetical protein
LTHMDNLNDSTARATGGKNEARRWERESLRLRLERCRAMAIYGLIGDTMNKTLRRRIEKRFGADS